MVVSLSQFKIEPALPTLWSSHDVPERLLKENDNHEDLETIYRNAVSAETVMAMPTSTVGTNSMARVPAFTLGGTPFVFGFALLSNRKIFGTFPAKNILPLNAVLVPLLIFGSCVYYLGGSTVVRADISAIQPFLGVLLGLVAGFGWITVTSAVAVYEHRLYSSKMSQRALELGMNHIETAQMYMTSESFVRPCAQQQKEKHKKEQSSKQKDLMIQTKVRPYKGANGYAKTVQACIENLGVSELDFLAVHGVNLAEHVDDAIACARACKPLLDSQMIKTIGFSFHCHKKDAIRIMDTGLFEFVNMHFNFFGGYTNFDTAAAVDAAHARQMGVMCISPNDKSGHLHTPSDKLKELCQPLHPMEFNMLFQLTYPGVNSISIGPGELSHYDIPVNVLRLLPVAKDILPPIVHRIRTHAKRVMGDAFLTSVCDGVEGVTQGEGFPPMEEEGGMKPIAVSLLVMCSLMNRLFGMTSFGKAMHGNLSYPGD
eukprot:scaffold168096_cov48-Attheya_sp.AAC.1